MISTFYISENILLVYSQLFCGKSLFVIYMFFVGWTFLPPIKHFYV